jgi:heme/copper-type cytochrome/quinol oxidase subunit 2
LSAARSGFNPSSITVNKGDTLNIDFTAVDDDYDFDILYMAFYYPKVFKGTTKKLIFDAATPGTFAFSCRDYCPSGGQIKGQLIVLP